MCTSISRIHNISILKFSNLNQIFWQHVFISDPEYFKFEINLNILINLLIILLSNSNYSNFSSNIRTFYIYPIYSNGLNLSFVIKKKKKIQKIIESRNETKRKRRFPSGNLSTSFKSRAEQRYGLTFLSSSISPPRTRDGQFKYRGPSHALAAPLTRGPMENAKTRQWICTKGNYAVSCLSRHKCTPLCILVQLRPMKIDIPRQLAHWPPRYTRYSRPSWPAPIFPFSIFISSL